MHTSISLTYEPSSEPLQFCVKWLFLDDHASFGGCSQEEIFEMNNGPTLHRHFSLFYHSRA